MKLTKKVLSLILAAALLVGTVAIAANAEGLTQYEGSVMSYFITSDKDVSDGNAEVKPGETITVTVSMTTNFYPSTSGGETIFWTRGFFESDTPEVVMDDVMDWWKHTTNYPVTSSAAYATDYPMDSYIMYLNNRAVNTDMIDTETYVFDNQTLYTVTFTVPEDAEVGSSAVIALPASKLATATQTGRNYTMCQSVSGTTYLSAQKAKGYAETVNVDALTITVVEEQSEEPPVTQDPIFTYEGSEMSYFITSDKDVSDGKAEVKPGDTLNVTVSMSTNFYPSTSGGETIFWTRGFFESDTPEVVMDDVMDWWKHTTNYPVTSSAAYATDYPMDSYIMYLNNRAVNTDMIDTETYAFNNQTLYTMSFQIPADAEVGSTAVIALPASKLATATQTGRNYTMCQSISGTTYLSANKIKGYAETVNVDLLEITVVADGEVDPPVVEIDYADLEAKIAEVKDTDTSLYTTETANRFTAALAAAQDLVTNKSAESQDEVTSALTELTSAYEALALIEYCDYTALEEAKDAYEAIINSGDIETYTESTGTAASTAYGKAVEVAENMVKSDENQAMIDAAFTALHTALNALEKKADMTALQAAVDAEPTVAQEYATSETWDAYATAKAAAEELLANADDIGVSQAETVAAAAKALTDANAALVEADADYSAVDAAKEKIPADLSIYTTESVKALEDAVAAVETGLKKSEQAKVDEMAKAIENAIEALDPIVLDTAKWDAAVAKIPASLDAYKPASVTAYETAKAAAEEAKAAAVEALDQTALDAAAEALEAAIALLEEKADKAALEAAIASASALEENNYTPDSWAAADLANVLDEANVVLANGDATTEEVAAAVEAINTAVAKLVVKADKGTLGDAIAAAKALEESAYTPDSWTAADLANVIVAAEEVYNDDNATAEAVAGAVKALADATAKLVEKADKAALEAAINEEVVLDNATTETLNAYNEALAAAKDVLADDNATADAVLTATNNLLAAIEGLKYYGACDYDAYNAAVDAAKALVEGEYTTSSWAAADIAAVLAANEVEEGLLDKDGNQDKINAATDAINAAVAKLEKKADVTALQAAVDAEPTVAQEYATAETWKAYADAKAAAEALLENAADLGESKADEIAAAAKALTDANAALVEETADYSEVVKAQELAAQQDLSDKTQASVKALEKALAAVVEGLGKSKQAEVDAMAKAINDAIEGLEVSEAAITKLDVDLSDYYARESREYTFTVTGAPAKIQIVYPTGGTATFDRYNRSISIVSYNADGEVVDYAEEAPAYEVWTVAISLGEGEYKARAKFGNQWEAFTFDFSVEIVDRAEEEVTFVAKPAGSEVEAGKAIELKKNTSAEITVIAPDNLIKVQLYFPTLGCTSTYTAANATVVDNGDGTCTWTIVRNMSRSGSYDMTLKLKDNSGWYDAVTTAIAVTCTAE